MPVATQRKPSTELLFCKNAKFESLRSTFEDCGWLTDGKVLFMPSESFHRKVRTLKRFRDMSVELPSAGDSIHRIVKDVTFGITRKINRIESIFSRLWDDVLHSEHNYREYGVDRKDRLQWNGGYVDMIFSQYKDATLYLSDTKLVFKVGNVVVAIVQGIVCE